MSLRRHASTWGSILLFLIAAQNALGRQTQPIVTIVADFDDNTVAAGIVDVRNVLAGDCFARRASIPARGLGALAVEIGATIPGASLAADLLLRVPVRFDQADRVAAYCWIKSDQVRLGFRIRDAADQVFETPLQTVRSHNRWINVEADLKPSALRRVRGEQALTWPIQILGLRVETDKIGRQTAYLDELRVEHRVRRHETIVGSFSFDRLTKIYEPGATVSAIVSLE
ncbi:MAG: hypothetical protein IID33_15835, partial [Planctomycetes bacterium]|nr:hypothetical protein [Planctomycetota bacterium]